MRLKFMQDVKKASRKRLALIQPVLNISMLSQLMGTKIPAYEGQIPA